MYIAGIIIYTTIATATEQTWDKESGKGVMKSQINECYQHEGLYYIPSFFVNELPLILLK